MKKILLSSLFALGFAGTASAAVQNLDCALNSWEEQGWIPERVLFSIDPDTKQARVFDGFVNEAEGKPIAAKFKTVRGGKYRMAWKLNLVASNGQDIRVNYTATYDPSSNAFNLRGNFPMVNATNRPSGDGSCKLVKGQSLF